MYGFSVPIGSRPSGCLDIPTTPLVSPTSVFQVHYLNSTGSWNTFPSYLKSLKQISCFFQGTGPGRLLEHLAAFLGGPSNSYHHSLHSKWSELD